MKVVGWLVGLIVLVVVGIGAYVFLYSGSLIKDAIENIGPDYLGARIRVDSVEVSLAEGSAGIRGLEIGNPGGYPGGYAMRLGSAKVTLEPSQVSETLVVLKEVVIDGADLAAVAKGKKTNFQQLLDNVTASTGGDAGAGEQAASGPEMKFIVDRLEFTNAKASLSSDLLGEAKIDIPDIMLRDIGRKSDGVTGAELAKQILKPLSDAITREAVEQGLDIEGAKANLREKASEKVNEKINSALEGLTNRLKKRD